MKAKEVTLPKGILASSLVDTSHLGLEEDAADRVAMKISEAVLYEYSRLEKPSSFVLAGRISDVLKIPDISWVGIIRPDIALLKEKGFAVLDEALHKVIEQH